MLAVEPRVMISVGERPRSLPTIEFLTSPVALASLEIDPGLGVFCAYGPEREGFVRQALGRALRGPGSEACVAISDGVIVGYILTAPAGIDQPWGILRDRRIHEVVLEVGRGFRGRGVAAALLRRTFSRPEVEARIYVAAAYRWCWDLQGTGVAAVRYAERLLRLLEGVGFRHEWTSEPNVALEPVNFLAVRVGRQVPPDLVRRFRQAQRGDLVA